MTKMGLLAEILVSRCRESAANFVLGKARALTPNNKLKT